MHILLLTAYFPPDGGSASHLFYELGQTFVFRGHTVSVVTGFPSYHATESETSYHGKLWMYEEINGIRIYRIATPQIARNTPLGRGLWQFGCAFTFLLRSLFVPKVDVSLVYSPPLPLGLSALLLRKIRHIPTIINIQDLFPQSAIDLGVLRHPNLIRMFETIERMIYREADMVAVHSSGNQKHVVRNGRHDTQTKVVHNAVDVVAIRPQPKVNVLRKTLGLEDRFVVSFAGVMGYSQDLDTILAAANNVRDHEAIHFLLVGDGLEKERLVQKSKTLGLQNVTWLPMQPRNEYPAILAASDVGLATLRAEVKTPVVPSKILNIMAAGRPVVAALDQTGDAPKIITEAQAGINVPAEDVDALSDALLRLYNNRAICQQYGDNGRSYAERHLSQTAICRQYEAIFRQILLRLESKRSGQTNLLDLEKKPELEKDVANDSHPDLSTDVL